MRIKGVFEFFLSFLAVVLTACSPFSENSESKKVEVSLRIKAPKNQTGFSQFNALNGMPTSAANFPCIAINIIGPEGALPASSTTTDGETTVPLELNEYGGKIISTDETRYPASLIENVINTEDSCAYPGVTSPFIPLNAGDVTLSLTVPIGINRVIQILGVADEALCTADTQTNWGTLLAASDQPEVEFGSMYEIGRLVVPVLDKSGTFDVPNVYDSTNPKNANCYNSLTADSNSAPTNLVLSSLSSTQIDLTWTDNAYNEEHYHVERSSDGVNFTELTSGSPLDPDTTTYSDTGLTSGQLYYYRVRASNDGGLSPPTDVLSLAPLSTPTTLVVSDVDSTKIEISWGDIVGEQEYEIHRSTDGTNYSLLSTEIADVTTYEDSALTPEQTYYYLVRAKNAADYSSFSSAVTSSALIQPTNFAVTATSSTTVDLTWDDNSITATDYIVERSTDGTTYSLLLTTGDGDATSASDSGLSAGTTYYYRVRATDGANGYASFSNVDSSAIIAAPTSLAVSLTSATQSSVTWNAVTGATDYYIQSSTDGGTTWSAASSTGGSTTSLQPGLTPDSTYTYRVYAINADGQSGYSNLDNITPLSVPTGVSAVLTAASDVQISWTDVSSAETNYEIQRSIDNGTSWPNDLTDAAADASSTNDNGIAADEYKYRVRAAHSDGGYSDWAESGLIRTLAAPTSLTATLNSPTSITLNWTDTNEGALVYEIRRQDNGTGGFTPLVTTATGAITYTDTSPTAGNSYEYQVLAKSGSVYSSAATHGSVSTLETPTVFNVVLNSTTEAGLTWGAVTGATDYFVERSAISSTGPWDAALSTGGNTFYNDSGLTLDTTYYYRVYAYDGSSNSDMTSVEKISTLNAPTSAAAALSAASDVSLTWTDNSSIELSYEIQRSIDGGSTWPVALVNEAADAQSALDSGLAADEYKYRVRAAHTDGGYSDWAETTLVRTLALPTGVTLTLNSPTSIDVDWTDTNESAVSYRIYRRIDAGSYVLQSTEAAGTTNYADTVSAGATYTYAVSAYSGGIESTLVASTPVVSLATPTGFTVTMTAFDSIDLDWTDVANETDYYIERNVNAGGWVPLNNVTSNIINYTDTGLSPETTYEYRIYAQNGDGDSEYSTAVTITTLAAPTGISATLNTATSIDLSWSDNSTNETGFEIERRVNAGTWAYLTTVVGTSHTDSGLTGNQTYEYRVRAESANAFSDWNTSGSVITLAAPSSLNATINSPTSIDLTWTDNNSGETNFVLERSDNGGAWTAITSTIPADTTTYTDTTTVAEVDYDYRVKAKTASVQGPASNVASVTTLATPTALTAGLNGFTNLRLLWTDNSTREINYEIEYQVNGGGWSPLSTVGVDVTVYDHNTLSIETTYDYRVRATNGDGASEWSNEDSKMILAPPSSLNAVTFSATRIDLTWVDNSANETDYEVQRSDFGMGNWAVIGTSGGSNTTTYSDTNAVPGHQYAYRVRATAGAGFINSNFSNESDDMADTLTVTVDPLFPSIGDNWNEYVQADATGTACLGGGTEACIHGGDKKLVDLTAAFTDCTDMTATDSLGVFDWECDDTGPNAVFTSKLKANKGLRHLINFSFADIDMDGWLENTIDVQFNGTTVATSAAADWWSNPIVDLTVPSNPDTAGSIYILPAAYSSNTYSLGVNGIAIVIQEGITLSLNAGQTTMISSTTTNYLWIEGGTIDCSNESIAEGVYFSGVHHSQIIGVDFVNCPGEAYQMYTSNYNVLRDITINASDYNIILNNSDFNRLENISFSNAGIKGLLVTTGSDNNEFYNIESLTDAQAIEVASSLNNYFYDISVHSSGGDGIYINTSDSNIFEEVYITSSSGDGIEVNLSDVNIIYKLRSTNNVGSGVTVTNSSMNNVISEATISNNQSHGLSVNGASIDNNFNQILSFNNGISSESGVFISSANNNTYANITVANHYGDGIYIGASDNSTFINILAINNGANGIHADSESNGSDYLSMAGNYNGASGLRLVGIDNYFYSNLVMGMNTTLECDITPDNTNTNVTNTTCAATGANSVFLDGLVSDNADMGSDFFGLATADSNPDNIADGSDGIVDHGLITDWFSFDNMFRAWGKGVSTFTLVSSNQGQCTSGNCGIWDWSFAAGGGEVANIHNGWSDYSPGAACPSSVHGDEDFTDQMTAPNTFLVYATEILLDGVGDDDSLCETNESCIFTPNIGAYQGHGGLAGNCTFTDGGTVIGVNLDGYSVNGR